MAWIKTISEAEAGGTLRREYQAALRRAGKIYNILKVSSLRPAILHSSIRFYVTLMHETATLSRAQREMIAVVVSRTNQCDY